MNAMVEHLQLAHAAASEVHHERRAEAQRTRREYVADPTDATWTAALLAYGALIRAEETLERVRAAHVAARELRDTGNREG